MFSKKFFVALGIVGLATGAPLAMAGSDKASQPTPEPQQTQAAPQAQVSDETVENFAAAYVDVSAVHSDYSQKIQQADEPEKKQSLQEEAKEEMKQAITNNDISLEEYQQVAMLLRDDNDLRLRVQAELQPQAPE